MPLISFYTPWKHQKTTVFLMFSGGIEKQRHKMSWQLTIHVYVFFKAEHRKLALILSSRNQHIFTFSIKIRYSIKKYDLHCSSLSIETQCLINYSHVKLQKLVFVDVFRNIHRKTLVLESLFNKNADWGLQLY